MGRPQQYCGRSRALRRGLSRPRGTVVVALTALLAVGSAFVASYAAAEDTPAVSVQDAETLEGGPGGSDHTVAVQLRLSAASAVAVTVDWTTVDGTAKIDQGDYDGDSGTVRFEPGDTSEFVEVNIDGGLEAEWNEYFTMFLRNPVNTVIGRAIGKVTIVNDDGQPEGVDPGNANVAPVAGEGQCVALKNGQGCQPLEVGQLVDLDEISVIDPGAGRVEVRADAGVGQFYGGKFGFEDIQVSEAIAKPILVVKLTGGNFKQCTTSNRSLAAKGAPVRRLWGKGKGRFRTRGRYSSGTVRGTSWITEDFCDGTRTRVFVGVVQVYDFVTKQTVAVKAGQSYFAKAGKVN